MSNGLDQHQDRCSISPDMDPNCCKGYQQATKTAASKVKSKQLNLNNINLIIIFAAALMLPFL